MFTQPSSASNTPTVHIQLFMYYNGSHQGQNTWSRITTRPLDSSVFQLWISPVIPWPHLTGNGHCTSQPIQGFLRLTQHGSHGLKIRPPAHSSQRSMFRPDLILTLWKRGESNFHIFSPSLICVFTDWGVLAILHIFIQTHSCYQVFSTVYSALVRGRNQNTSHPILPTTCAEIKNRGSNLDTIIIFKHSTHIQKQTC